MEKYKNYLKTEPEVVTMPKKLDVNDLEELVGKLKENLTNAKTAIENNAQPSQIHSYITDGLAEIDKVLG